MQYIKHSGKNLPISCVLGCYRATIDSPSPDQPIRIVYVVFPNAEPRDIQLTDLAGRLHTSWKSYKNNDLLLNKLIPGSYTLRVTNMITNKKEVIRVTVVK